MSLFNKKFLRVPHLSIGEAIHEGGRNPFVDWIMILIVSTIVSTVLLVGGVILYQRVTTGAIHAENQNSGATAKTFDQKELKIIIDRFNAKNDAQAQIKKGYSGPSDPSL